MTAVGQKQTPLDYAVLIHITLMRPPVVKRQTRPSRGFFSFATVLIRATSARGLVSCLDFSIWVQVLCACTKHLLRFYRHEMAIAERLCTVLCDLETYLCPRTGLLKEQAEHGSFAS
jgi:hypothetical protein